MYQHIVCLNSNRPIGPKTPLISPSASRRDKLACLHSQSSRLPSSFELCCLASEKSQSQGTETDTRRARADSCWWAPAWVDHHCRGQSSMLMLGSALQRLRAPEGPIYSSESDSEANSMRLLFFFASSSEGSGVAPLGSSCSSASRLVQTSSLSLLLVDTLSPWNVGQLLKPPWAIWATDVLLKGSLKPQHIGWVLIRDLSRTAYDLFFLVWQTICPSFP